MKNKIKEIISAIAVILVAIIIMDPMGFYYSEMQTASLVVVLLVAFVAFQSFIWKAKALDEREEELIYKANATAYLAGTGIITVGLIFQAFSHSIDIWLVIALFSMILARMVSCFYLE